MIMSFYSAAKIRAGLRDFLLGRLIAVVLSFATNILIVRELSDDAYANYATLIGLQLSLLSLLSFGIERVMARYAGEGAMRWTATNLARLIGGGVALRAFSILAVAVLLIPFSNFVADFLHLRTWESIAIAFWIYTLFFGVTEVLQSVAQGFMCQKEIRFSLTLLWSARVFAISFYMISGLPFGLYEAVCIFAASSLIPCLILLLPVYQVIKNKRTKSLPTSNDMQNFNSVVLLGGHNYLEKLASLPTSGGFLRLIAASALSSAATASFGFFQMLWGTLHRYMPTTMLMGMLEATVAGRFSENRDSKEMDTALSAIFKINLMFVVPLVAWLAVSGRDVVSILTGGKYVDHAWAFAVIASGLLPASLWQVVIVRANTLSVSSVLYKSSALISVFVVPIGFVAIKYPETGLFLLSSTSLVLGLAQVGLAMIAMNSSDKKFNFETRGILVLVGSGVAAGLITSLIQYGLAGFNSIVSAVLSGACVGSFFILISGNAKVFVKEEIQLVAKLNANLARPLALFGNKA